MSLVPLRDVFLGTFIALWFVDRAESIRQQSGRVTMLFGSACPQGTCSGSEAEACPIWDDCDDGRERCMKYNSADRERDETNNEARVWEPLKEGNLNVDKSYHILQDVSEAWSSMTVYFAVINVVLVEDV